MHANKEYTLKDMPSEVPCHLTYIGCIDAELDRFMEFLNTPVSTLENESCMEGDSHSENLLNTFLAHLQLSEVHDDMTKIHFTRELLEWPTPQSTRISLLFLPISHIQQDPHYSTEYIRDFRWTAEADLDKLMRMNESSTDKYTLPSRMVLPGDLIGFESLYEPNEAPGNQFASRVRSSSQSRILDTASMPLSLDSRINARDGILESDWNVASHDDIKVSENMEKCENDVDVILVCLDRVEQELGNGDLGLYNDTNTIVLAHEFETLCRILPRREIIKLCASTSAVNFTDSNRNNSVRDVVPHSKYLVSEVGIQRLYHRFGLVRSVKYLTTALHSSHVQKSCPLWLKPPFMSLSQIGLDGPSNNKPPVTLILESNDQALACKSERCGLVFDQKTRNTHYIRPIEHLDSLAKNIVLLGSQYIDLKHRGREIWNYTLDSDFPDHRRYSRKSRSSLQRLRPPPFTLPLPRGPHSTRDCELQVQNYLTREYSSTMKSLQFETEVPISNIDPSVPTFAHIICGPFSKISQSLQYSQFHVHGNFLPSSNKAATLSIAYSSKYDEYFELNLKSSIGTRLFGAYAHSSKQIHSTKFSKCPSTLYLSTEPDVMADTHGPLSFENSLAKVIASLQEFVGTI